MSTPSTEVEPKPAEPGGNVSRTVAVVGAAWFLSLGFDAFLHAGLLARFYVEPSAFLLDPRQAFQRVPLGYLAFLILAFGLFWLYRRMQLRGMFTGFRFGLGIGLVTWGAFSLGLYSASSIPPALAVGWWLGQAIELGLVGAVLGAAAKGARLGRIWVAVMVLFVVLIVATIVMQSLGWAPAMKMGG